MTASVSCMPGKHFIILTANMQTFLARTQDSTDHIIQLWLKWYRQHKLAAQCKARSVCKEKYALRYAWNSFLQSDLLCLAIGNLTGNISNEIKNLNYK